MARIYTQPKPKKSNKSHRSIRYPVLVWAVHSPPADNDGPDGDGDADDAAPPSSP